MTIRRQRPGVAARGVEGESVCLNSTVPGNGDAGPPAAAGPVPESLIDILRRLADALDRQAAPPRMAWRLSEIASMIGVSPRLLQMERAAGRMPPADVRIGKSKVLLWRRETIDAWLTQQAPRRGGRA
jgi:hypothetical protein